MAGLLGALLLSSGGDLRCFLNESCSPLASFGFIGMCSTHLDSAVDALPEVIAVDFAASLCPSVAVIDGCMKVAKSGFARGARSAGAAIFFKEPHRPSTGGVAALASPSQSFQSAIGALPTNSMCLA